MRTSLKLQIQNIEDRLQVLQDRSHVPNIQRSELNRIQKREKKLLKSRAKLLRKLKSDDYTFE